MPRGRPKRLAVYERFDSALGDLRHLGGLPRPVEAEAIWDDIWHLEVHNSTAIEGNTLVLREVERLLDTGRAIGAKPLKDYLEVQGYGSAARWVYAHGRDPGDQRSDRLITVTEIREIHRQTMTPVWEVAPHPEAGPAESPGNFRQHDLHPFSGGMRATPWPDVSADLSTWVERAGGLAALLEVDATRLPEQLADLHAAFERVHPFIDGNGRTGRLVMNLLLVRLGFPPVIIFKRQRDQYLDALDRADAGEPGPLAELIVRSVVDNLYRFVVPNIAGPARLVPLRALTDSTLSYAALRQAAQRGRLEAQRSADGTWRSTRYAVDKYRQSRWQR